MIVYKYYLILVITVLLLKFALASHSRKTLNSDLKYDSWLFIFIDYLNE